PQTRASPATPGRSRARSQGLAQTNSTASKTSSTSSTGSSSSARPQATPGAPALPAPRPCLRPGPACAPAPLGPLLLLAFVGEHHVLAEFLPILRFFGVLEIGQLHRRADL